MSVLDLPTALEIINEIENLSKKLNISPAKLLRKADIATSTYSKWKKGDHDPSLNAVKKIKDAFEILKSEATK